MTGSTVAEAVRSDRRRASAEELVSAADPQRTVGESEREATDGWTKTSV
jgi:hypothetical protein